MQSTTKGGTRRVLLDKSERVARLETFVRWAADRAQELEASSCGTPRGFLRTLAAEGQKLLRGES